MGDVVQLLLPVQESKASTKLSGLPLAADTSDPLTRIEGCLKMQEIRDEFLRVVGDPDLQSGCECRITEGFSEEAEELRFGRVLELDEIVVFSMEIQQTGFAGPEGEYRAKRPVGWGDVFVKVGDEYVFLLTVYTARYVREQFQRHGERVRPSSRDIILHRDLLVPEDIIRAVIKWTNKYSPQLAGKPVHLEKPSVLQTLVCDPGVEITCSAPS